MFDLLQFEFMRNALLAGLLASVICGVIGSLVVVNRIVFISGGIAHAAYGGIGLAFFCGWPYLVGTLGFALAAALVMAAVTLKARHRADTIIGVIWAIGMAVGVVLLDLTPGYNVDLMSYLFGSILAVPGAELGQMAVLTVVVLAVVGWCYPDLLAMAYDEEFARVRGVPVTALHFLLLALIAVTVVVVIRIVGLILVIALMTIPPYIAEQFSGSLKAMMINACGLSVLFTLSGLGLAYRYNLSSGAAIILVAGAAFFMAMGLSQLISRRRRAAAHNHRPNVQTSPASTE